MTNIALLLEIMVLPCELNNFVSLVILPSLLGFLLSPYSLSKKLGLAIAGWLGRQANLPSIAGGGGKSAREPKISPLPVFLRTCPYFEKLSRNLNTKVLVAKWSPKKSKFTTLFFTSLFTQQLS